MLLPSFPSTEKELAFSQPHCRAICWELQDAVVPCELQEEAYASVYVFMILRVESIRSEQLGSFVSQYKENGWIIKDNVRKSCSRVADTKSEALTILGGHCCYFLSALHAYADLHIRKGLEGGFQDKREFDQEGTLCLRQLA